MQLEWIKNKKYLFLICTISVLALVFLCKNINGYLLKFYSYKINKYTEEADFLKAETFLQKKLKLAQKDKYFYETTRNDLIRFYFKQRLYTEAKKLLIQQMSIGIYSTVYGTSLFADKELAIGDAYSSLALLSFYEKQYDSAKKYENIALDNYKQRSGYKEPLFEIITSYRILCLSYLKENNYKKAAECLEKIKFYSKMNSIEQKNGEEAFFTYYNVAADYYIAIKDYKNARLYANKMYTAIPLAVLPEPVQTQTNIHNEFIPFINEKMGEIYYFEQRYEDAKRMYEMAYRIYKETKGEYSPNTACAAYHLSNMYKQNGNIELHKKYLYQVKDSIKHFRALKNTNDANFTTNMNSFCNYYEN